jgi:hypothetical protein
LRHNYKIETITSDDDLERLKKWPLDALNIPCWFVEDKRGNVEDKCNKKSIYKIKIYSHSNGNVLEELLQSPSEYLYEEMNKVGYGLRFTPQSDIQRDYGIFARFSKDNYQHIIIAGIHQYGTWIVAQLLNDLLCGEKMEYCSTFLDNNDFISIITGEFVHKKLLVNKDSIEVLHKFIWVKEGDHWIRKPQIKDKVNPHPGAQGERGILAKGRASHL